jgi:TldD protein
MRDRMAEALKRSKADFTEIRIESKDSTAIGYRGQNLENCGTSRDVGGLVRVLHQGSWGVSTFNNLDELPRHIELALECAKSLTDGDENIAPQAPHEYEGSINIEQFFGNYSLAAKKEIVEHYNEVMLRQPGIKDASVTYSDDLLTMYYANSEGTYVKQARPYARLIFSAMATDGSNVQTARDNVFVGWDFSQIQGVELKIEAVAKRAVDLLKAEPIKAGNYTVVANSRLAGLFIHEAFGHLSEADGIERNPRAQDMMRLGRRFGPDILNVSDGGIHPNLQGTMLFDDEGTPTQETYMIRNGELVGRLHNRQTAARLGETPTGNARATDYRWPPIVRMTNTCIKPGETEFQDMIKDIELGIYALDSMGGQTAQENFSFSSAYAYMIRNGQIAEMVRDVILAGNVFNTLNNIEAIGNDFKWHAGFCGKGQGGWLPVSMGAPHLRIKNVLIGGQPAKNATNMQV